MPTNPYKIPEVKGNKQSIRMWFEFYKFCLMDKDFKKQVKECADFYKEWGDIRDLKFDDWWREKKYLFGLSQVEEIKTIKKYPNTLNVGIPLNQPISKTIQQIRQLVGDKQTERLEELGIDVSKVKSKSNVSFSKFEVTRGVEIRGSTLYQIQLMYGIWLELGKPAINTDFCIKVVDRISNRKRAKWIPYLLQIEPQEIRGKLEYSEEQLRQVRRYINKGEKICQSVCKGTFPGKNNL